MLVKIDLPPEEGYPDGKQVWLDAESVERVEGDIDWSKRQCTIYLKRNPTEPFLVVKKSMSDVVRTINAGLSGAADNIRDLAKEFSRIADELARRTEGE